MQPGRHGGLRASRCGLRMRGGSKRHGLILLPASRAGRGTKSAHFADIGPATALRSGGQVPYVLHAPSAEQFLAAAPGTATGPSGSARYAGRQQEAATGSVPRFPGETTMSYHPTADPGAHHEPFHVASGTPDRFAQVDLLPDLTATMRDGVRAGRRRLRAARPGAGAGDRDPPAVRQADARDGHGRGRRVLRPQGLRLRRAGRARQVLVRRRVRPRRRTRSRTATTRSSGSPRGVVQRPGRAVGRVVLRHHVVAAAISGHPAIACIAPGDIGIDWRGGWFRGAPSCSTPPATGRSRWTPGVRRPDARRPVAPAARRHGRGGRRRRLVLPRASSTTPTTPPGGARQAAPPAGRHPRAGADVGGWYDDYIGAQLADSQLIVDCTRVRSTVHLMIGPWDHEGSRRVHRSRGLLSSAADRRAPLGPPTRRSSTAT